MYRTLLAACLSWLCAPPALACWSTPDAYCFTRMWHDEALAHAAAPPRVAHLYDLLDWGVVPPGPDTALALLDGLGLDDLKAHHDALRAAEEPGIRNPMGDNAEPSFEIALLMLLGLFNSSEPEEIDHNYLLSIYDLARQTGNRDIAQRWYDALPPQMIALTGVESPDGTAPHPDPYRDAQAHTVATLQHLQSDHLSAAILAAEQATGEPAFLAWLALARHAIAHNDTALLMRASQGLDTALNAPTSPDMNEETFELALQAAEEEFARTGDPDAIAHVYEQMGGADILPVGAGLTVALVRRHLNRETGQDQADGWAEALAAIARATQNHEDEDDATAMRNARTALRLGLADEATQIVDQMFRDFPGVPGFQLHDLPATPEPWADGWLTRMIARYDAIIADPGPFETRDYWSTWQSQEALGEAIHITRQLALYGRVDEARSFADRAHAYLAKLDAADPENTLEPQAQIFILETTAWLDPPEQAATRYRQAGQRLSGLAYSYQRIGRFDLALQLVRDETGLRNLGHWMQQADDVPPDQHAAYTATLYDLIEDEIARLGRDGYPTLVQELLGHASGFAASQGDWSRAEGYYQRIQDATGKYGTIPGARNRMLTLRDITLFLSPPDAAIAYPYDDFAL